MEGGRADGTEAADVSLAALAVRVRGTGAVGLGDVAAAGVAVERECGGGADPSLAGLVGEEGGDVGGVVDGVVGVAGLGDVSVEGRDVGLVGAAIALTSADGLTDELVAVAGGPAGMRCDGGFVEVADELGDDLVAVGGALPAGPGGEAGAEGVDDEPGGFPVAGDGELLEGDEHGVALCRTSSLGEVSRKLNPETFAPSMAPHIALHEIGVPFTPRPLSFAHNETRSPEFLAINPAGKVPTLLIDGRPLTWLSTRFSA